MSESESLAQASVFGFCFSDGRGMLGRSHGPWTNLPLCGFGPIPIVFRQSVDGRTPFRFVTSGVPPKEEFQSRALGKSEGTTQTMVKNWGLGAWQARSTNHEKNSSGYEESASLRRLLRLLSLDFVSAMAVECRGGLMGHGRIFFLRICPESQLFFVNLWNGRTPFSFVTSGVPPKEEFQSKAMGKTEGTTQTIVRGLGAWQAPYAISSSSH